MSKIIFSFLFLGIFTLLPLHASEVPTEFDLAKQKINSLIFGENILPSELELENKKFEVEYTFDPQLSEFILAMLKKHKPNYSAVVVVDNETGDVLAAVGYEKKHNRINYKLPFSSSHPAASLAKFVTSAVLLDQDDLSPDDTLSFQGRGTTLKPSQLVENVVKSKKTKKRRRANRTKHISFVQAFASSNNPIFGKAAIQNISGELLKDMADRMGFNSSIMEDLDLPASEFHLASSPMLIAQYASGYNNLNTISPIHAAMLPSIVANDGFLKRPHIIKKITVDNHDLELPEVTETEVFPSEVASDLKQMMEATISMGTGRRSFINMKTSLLDQLDVGGKSGTFSGGVPYGKRDWFIAYAKPKDEYEGKGISVAVMNINSKKRIRSSRVVKDIVEFYFKDLQVTEDATESN